MANDVTGHTNGEIHIALPYGLDHYLRRLALPEKLFLYGVLALVVSLILVLFSTDKTSIGVWCAWVAGAFGVIWALAWVIAGAFMIDHSTKP